MEEKDTQDIQKVLDWFDKQIEGKPPEGKWVLYPKLKAACHTLNVSSHCINKLFELRFLERCKNGVFVLYLPRAFKAGKKEGIKEVMDWSDESCPHDIQELSMSGMCEYMKAMPEKKHECPLCRQAKLREWGLEKEERGSNES